MHTCNGEIYFLLVDAWRIIRGAAGTHGSPEGLRRGPASHRGGASAGGGGSTSLWQQLVPVNMGNMGYPLNLVSAEQNVKLL